jgi:hypothetical protein
MGVLACFSPLSFQAGFIAAIVVPAEDATR